MTTKVHSKKERTLQKKESFASKGYTYFEEVKAEFNRIQWTSQEELTSYTKIVVFATIIFGVGVFFTDLFFKNSLEAINAILRFIGA